MDFVCTTKDENQRKPKMKYLRTSDIFLKVMAFSVFLKYAYCGFLYHPILDDHIQYGVYKLYPPSHVFLTIGTITTRPVAAVLDYFLWARLPFSLSLILMGALHFLSAVFIYKTLKHCEIIPSGWFFVIYLLLPTVSEGVFWLSAATRIICGMFFAGSAALCFARGKKVAGAVLSLLSFGFYEQVAVFSFLLSAMVYAKNKKFPIILFSNAAFMAVYYFLMRNLGQYDLRFVDGLSAFDVIKNILRTYGAPAVGILKNGLWRGILLCVKNPLFLTGVLIVCYMSGTRSPVGNKSSLLLLVGAVLFFASYIPFFISGGQWISLRTGFVPAAGLAVMAGRIPFKKSLGAVVLLFLIINSTECYDYYMAGRYDKEFIQEIATSQEAVLVIPHTPKTTYPYHEHIESVSASDWALQGALHFATGKPANNFKVIKGNEKPATDGIVIFDVENFLWYIKD